MYRSTTNVREGFLKESAAITITTITQYVQRVTAGRQLESLPSLSDLDTPLACMMS